MLAPKSGSQTRSLIAGKAREGTDHLQHRAAELRDSVTGMVRKGREEVERQKAGLKQAIEAGTIDSLLAAVGGGRLPREAVQLRDQRVRRRGRLHVRQQDFLALERLAVERLVIVLVGT